MKKNLEIKIEIKNKLNKDLGIQLNIKTYNYSKVELIDKTFNKNVVIDLNDLLKRTAKIKGCVYTPYKG